MLADAIRTYNALLDTTWADSQDQLDRQTEQRQMYFGTRPVCSVLRPRFLSDAQFRCLQVSVRDLAPAFRKAYDAALADAGFRKQFLLRPEEEELLPFDPGFPDPSPTARLDSFFVSENELKYTEYNAETPAGAAYHDVLSELFLGLPTMQQFQRQYQVRPLPARPGVQHAVLQSYRQWRGNTSARPRIAIVDWPDVPTVSEFRYFEQHFRAQGYECQIVDPNEVTYENGTLRRGDYAFDLIYKRVIISELLEQGGRDHPIVRAVLAGDCCMVNAFRCKILFKKASFGVLSDERNARLFTDRELTAIHKFIPWTRVAEERKTVWKSDGIDLIPWTLANKDGLVLKPNDDYGGKGIVLGWTVDAASWEAAVKVALSCPYVIQERVNLPAEMYPGVGSDGKLHYIERMLDTNPFVCFGATMDGCLTRISTEALLNVTAGGGSTVPTFVVEDR